MKRRRSDENPKDRVGARKAPLGLLPASFLVPVCRVMETGGKKYGFWNWRATNVRYTVYTDAALRHLYAAVDGEDLDPESGFSHLAHAAACLLIVLDAAAVGTLIDDRNRGTSAALITADAHRHKERTAHGTQPSRTTPPTRRRNRR